jgi:hypothetical protein
MRTEFRMNEEQYAFMMAAMKEARNQRVMYLSGGIPMFDDPQEVANRAWKKLGGEMGFVWDTASAGSDDHSFFAEAREGGKH